MFNRIAASLGIKQRLLILVLLAVAPLVALIVWDAADDRRTAIEQAGGNWGLMRAYGKPRPDLTPLPQNQNPARNLSVCPARLEPPYQTRRYDVIATTNLNGDYISDALAAQVGGVGMAPGANINYEEGYAIFEATHGTAPKYAGLNKVNPSSLILSGALMLEHMGWTEAAERIEKGLELAFASRKVTYDLARLMAGSEEVSCSAFAQLVCENME